jgi:hypothetical protein
LLIWLLVGGSENSGVQFNVEKVVKRDFRKTQFTAPEGISALSAACYIGAAAPHSLQPSRISHFQD